MKTLAEHVGNLVIESFTLVNEVSDLIDEVFTLANEARDLAHEVSTLAGDFPDRLHGGQQNKPSKTPRSTQMHSLRRDQSKQSVPIAKSFARVLPAS